MFENSRIAYLWCKSFSFRNSCFFYSNIIVSPNILWILDILIEGFYFTLSLSIIIILYINDSWEILLFIFSYIIDDR